jgi:poly-gamma-glutamate synthesis protein (capsule biosynthesis protein)
MSTADGFTLAAVGDCIIARPVSQTPGFAPVGKILHDADAAFGNFEGTAIDLSRTPAVPQAEFGGVWIIGAPAVAKDLKSIGFDIMSRANNHATDWGLEGMRQTSRALDEAGIVHAGVGEHRAAARAARFFDTEKGRVALISLASTFTPLSRSAPPAGEAPGRPGVLADDALFPRHRRRAQGAAQDSRRTAGRLRARARERTGNRGRTLRRPLQGRRSPRLHLHRRSR